jgi:GntR family transcriptional regulator
MVAPSAVATALGLDKGERVIRILRQRLVDQQPLLVEEIWLPLARFAALLDIQPSDFGNLLYPMYEQHCGQIVASAKETLSVELVTAAHARLLEKAPGTPVILIERIAFAPDGTPIEWRRSRGPADQFTYHVEIR